MNHSEHDTDTHISEFAMPTVLRSGGRVHATTSDLTVSFDEIRYSLSTGPLNGGFHHVLAVRNQKLNYFAETEKDLPGGSAAGYLTEEFRQADLPAHFCTGILTSADMEGAVYERFEEDDLIVEVILTCGHEKTAHRAGDGWLYKEKAGHFSGPGTINMLVFTNKALTDGAMTKAFITMTEAKCAVLSDTGLKSVVSGAPASGTATDGIIFTIDTAGEILSDSGTFSFFGNALAVTVRRALARALNQ